MAGRCFQRTPDIVARTVADEQFLLPVKGELARRAELFALSEVGQFIWSRLDGSRDDDALVAEVLGEFDVAEAEARADVAEFLGRLLEFGLVEEAG